MFIDEVSGRVAEVVLAGYDPTVGTIFPHVFLSGGPGWAGK
jgi:hypothetical protein